MISPNKERFAITPKHCNSLKGLKLFSLKNSKGSSVIPSTKIFLDKFQIKKIKCDDGATTTVVLIVESKQYTLVKLMNVYDYRK